MQLTDPIDSFPYIGSAIAAKLENLGIKTIEDLLHHYPAKYLDRSTITPIAQIKPETSVTIIAQVQDFKNIYTKTGKNLQQAIVSDDTDQLTITWFNQRFLSRAINPGNTYSFSGKAKIFGYKLTLTAPDFEPIDDHKEQLHTGRLVPVYPETAGISSKRLRSRIQHALEIMDLPDHLSTQIKSAHNLIDLHTALHHIHFPENKNQIKLAKNRLGFDELFFLQLQGALKRHRLSQIKTNIHIKLPKIKLKDFYSHLPFTPTKAQTTAINEILSDLDNQNPMNRLLEGDVGSGKTLVATAAIYATTQSGYQTFVMAPTEILANQLYTNITATLAHTNTSISLVTGSSKQDPAADVLVGTHALLFAQTKRQVGLVVIDEQHRFGVEQRARLEQLAGHPHRLTMSATPIPRTIALTLYGDLSISVLDELPAHKKPVKTWLVPPAKRTKAYAWIKDQINAYQSQVFVVCPLIDPSEAEKLSEVKSATDEYQSLKKIFPRHRLALIHGKIKPKEKDQILTDFRNKKYDLLVATPVIEVGIDIPGAHIIIIEAADRFGLAQLHQLRGRVGRAGDQGYCLLFTSRGTSSKRLETLTTTQSGFKLAQIDLKLRGPGEVFGINQHGFNQLKIARLTNKKLIQATKTAADHLVSLDPKLSNHPAIRSKLNSLPELQTTSN